MTSLYTLIAFGCSNTIGEGLVDSPPMTEKISQYSWPIVLGKIVNRQVVNKGKPGASNLQILSEILNFQFKETDIAVVMWSFPQRDVVFNESNEHLRLGTWSTTSNEISEYAKSWILNSTDIDLYLRSWLAITHAYRFLNSLSIKFLFVDIQQDQNFILSKPAWASDIKFMPIDGHRYFLDMPKAEDSIHPGYDWHKLIATLISKEIINE